MNGLCDVNGCTRETYMGWRPLTERQGRQICEYHWRRHRDPEDSFDLFEAFGFERTVGLPRQVAKIEIPLCSCGRERKPRCRLCAECAAERERQRKKRYYHDRKNRPAQPVIVENTLRCRECGDARLPGHTYCEKCADRRKKMTRRRAQSSYWRKSHKHHGLD